MAADGKETGKTPVFQRYTQNAPAKIRIWQDRSGVARNAVFDIGIREGRDGCIVVVSDPVSYVASTWYIGAGVLI